jgi:uncharacterized membrane protein YhaH (DUF805 family)
MQKPKFFIPILQWLSAHGRISRLQYFVYGLIMAATFFAFALVLALNGFMNMDEDGHITSLNDFWTYGLLQFCLFYILFCLASKRLHDLNWPAWLAVLLIFDIPVDLAADLARMYLTLPEMFETIVKGVDLLAKLATLGLGISLTFRPGDKGQNKYGPDPLKAPTPPVEVF